MLTINGLQLMLTINGLHLTVKLMASNYQRELSSQIANSYLQLLSNPLKNCTLSSGGGNVSAVI